MSSRDTEGVAAIYFFIAVRDCFVTTLPAYRRQACLSADRLAMTILINPNSKVKHELFDFLIWHGNCKVYKTTVNTYSFCFD